MVEKYPENTTINCGCQYKIITLLERLGCYWSGLQLFRSVKILGCYWSDLPIFRIAKIHGYC